MPGAWNSPRHPIFDVWVGDPYLIGWCPAWQARMSTAPYCIPIAKSMMISPWWGWMSALGYLGAGTQAGKAATMLQLHWLLPSPVDPLDPHCMLGFGPASFPKL